MAYTFKLVSLLTETSNRGKKVLDINRLESSDFLDEMVDCIIKVYWENGPNAGKNTTLLLSHGCRWPEDLLEKADLIEGCNTPVDAFKYKHKMVLLPHPKDVTTMLSLNKDFYKLLGRELQEGFRFELCNKNNMRQVPNKPQPVKLSPVRPHPNVEVEAGGLRVGSNCPRDGVYVAVETSPYSLEPSKLVVTENHYDSGLWKPQLIQESGFNGLFQTTEMDDKGTYSYSEVECEGGGFMYPQVLPYEMKYGPIFRLEKKILHVTQDIPEGGWGVAVPLT